MREARKLQPLHTLAMYRCISGILCAALTCSSAGCGLKKIDQTTIPAATVETTAPPATEAPTEQPTEPPVPVDYTLCFAGDVCYEDGGYTTNYWKNCGEDAEKCFDAVMMEHMQNADVFFLNNEFQFTERGTRTPGKEFTFRSNPENVHLLNDLGTDLVSLANNHSFDYGEEGLLDTFDTLNKAGIPYVGAGRDIEEASSTYYYDLDGMRTAFISSTRVELRELTRGAAENQPGVFRTVDEEQVNFLYSKIREARENADYVIVYIHWGDEFTTAVDAFQTVTGNALIEAGADAVIGDHPHVLQGIRFHQGKPILYSLGNYWFRACSGDTALAELHITGTKGNYRTELKLVPAVLANAQVRYISDAGSQKAFYDRMVRMSFGISIDENGIVTEAEETEN